MKIFVAILVSVACIAAADAELTVKSKEKPLKIREDCLKGNPLTFHQEFQIHNFGFEIPNEIEIRKYVLCLCEKSGIFSSDVGFDVDRSVKSLIKEPMSPTEPEVKKLVEDCIVQFPKADKPNDVVAYEFFKCIRPALKHRQNDVKSSDNNALIISSPSS